MTLYIPLDATTHPPISPPFLAPSSSPVPDLTTVIRSILRAKRITVVCGAGISVGAGIPDFRSQDGLFQSLKRDHPKESLSSGKDLFDASVFKSTEKTALFYRMIARLSSLSSQGQPTAFHQLLRALDDRGQLLRVYTQNIDALEMKAGLSFGVPEFEEKKLRVKLKGKAKVKARETGSGAYNARLGGRKRKRLGDESTTQLPSPAPPPPPPPNYHRPDSPGPGPSTPVRHVSSPVPPTTGSLLNVVPRCIPLHGTLLTLHCQHCTQSFPLDPHTPPPVTSISPPPSPGARKDEPSPSSLHSLLALGTPPPCPSCTSLEQTRALVGKRLRGVGKLRPSVVLYGEEHREGEGVGEAVRRDLCGISDAPPVPGSAERADGHAGTTASGATPTKSRVRARRGPDLLLVVGTSLRVPGTKRIVREFSKAVRPSPSPATSRLPTPTPSPPAGSGAPPEQIRTVYLNLEFPLPAREWEGVFDVWVNGDVQEFAGAVAAVMRSEEEERARKRQRAAAKRDMAAREKGGAASGAAKLGRRKGEAAAAAETPMRPSKRRKVDVDIPPTPVSLSKALAREREPGYAEDTWTDAPPVTPTRRVILRLPPPPPPPTPRTPTRTRALKRKRTVPEVVITSKPGRFTHLKPLATRTTRSLSPLTSLSSLSSPLSPLSPLPSDAASSAPSSPRADADAVDVRRAELQTAPMRHGVGAEAEAETEARPGEAGTDSGGVRPSISVCATRADFREWAMVGGHAGLGATV